MRLGLILLFLFLVVPFSSAFQGQGDCNKLLSDFAQLTNKSVFIPSGLSGSCVVRSEKDFPLILKNAGFRYSEKGSFLNVVEIPPQKEKEKEVFRPSPKLFQVAFSFINVSTALDCGLTLKDVLFSFENLDYSFSVGGSLGCPALDLDGSFSFKVNAGLVDSWKYTHGFESQRANSEITSSTGAVTTSYSYITTGLELSLSQTEKGVYYSLRYVSKSGAVTTSAGLVVPLVQADILEEVKQKRKLWIVPLGWENSTQKYKLILQIKELEN